MNKIYFVGLISTALLMQSCATIVKSPQTIVTFQGDVHSDTEVITPYGSTRLKNGVGSVVMNNSKRDLQIQVVCNNQDPVSATLPTSYSIGTGVFGNLGLTLLYIIPGVVGFIIDGAGDTAYSPVSPFNVTQYCSSSSKTNATKTVSST